MAEILGTYVLGTDTISTIEAGVQNENDASCVKFDYSDWKEEYGDGILSMRIQRREDDDPYPVLLTVSTDPDDGENVMVWSISDVDTAQIGKHKAQLTYTVDGVRKKTTVFLYRIVRSVVSGDTVPDPYDDWLEDLESMASDMLDDGAAIVNEAKGYRNEASGYATAASGSATSASNSASDSEAYAKGTRGGTEVESDDPSYHNNSKYYSEQAYLSSESASGYASNASESAIDASGSATSSAGHSQNSEAWAKGTRGGTPVGSDDPAYHNNSSYYAGQADSSAYDANQSNVEAAQHESNAEAFASGTRNTVPVSSTDPAYHNNSKYFSGQASASATAASGSATAAAGSATAAAASVSSLAPAYSSSATYDVGDYVLYSGSLYRCTTEITTAEEWTASHWTSAKMSEDLKSDFDNKADIDGSYPELSAGNITGDYHLDSDPYLFRPTGGSADVGNREYLDNIVGGTVGWNQLIPNPTSPLRDTSMIVFNSGTQIIKGHRYIVAFNGKKIDESGNDVNAFWYVNENGGADPYNIAIGTTKIITPTRTATSNGSYNGNNNTWFYIGGISNATINSFNVIDLTQMFGTTIADYIYSLEQSQAGAGVAWFRNYFPKDYYPYDPGTLRSVEGVSAHETVGFNQWDEEWESGAIDGASGGAYTDSTRIRSKNYVSVLPNTVYYVKMPYAFNYAWYDAGKQYIGGDNSASPNYARISPNNARYLKFSTAGTTYKNDICINLSDPSRNGEYEPYQKHTYPLDSSLTLRGVPKLVDGKLEFDGDVYQPSGEVQRRYGIVDLGTLDWLKDNDNIFRTAITGIKPQSDSEGYETRKQGAICAKYAADSQISVSSQMGDKTWLRNANTIFIRDTSYTDATSFKSAMSGVYLVYPLATPTTETAEGYEQYQICDPSGTEEFVTTGIVPVGHETAYELNLAQKLINLPWDMSMIAPVEDGATASQAYAQGKYFLRNNEFCKAKTAIASGATFTLNTNYEVTTVAAELFAALS